MRVDGGAISDVGAKAIANVVQKRKNISLLGLGIRYSKRNV